MDIFLKKKIEIDNMVRKVFDELEEDIERNLRSCDVAQWYYNVGDFESALTYINKFLFVDPDNTKAQELLVLIIQGIISSERPPYFSRGEFAYEDADDFRSEEQTQHLDKNRRYHLWQSCLADVKQAISCLNSGLDRLTATCMERHHTELISHLFNILQRLLDVSIAMINHDVLTENSFSEQFTEEGLVWHETQGSHENRDEGNAFQQALARQNQLLEKLQNQATTNENLLKNALEKIHSLNIQVTRLSGARKTEPLGSD